MNCVTTGSQNNAAGSTLFAKAKQSSEKELQFEPVHAISNNVAF